MTRHDFQAQRGVRYPTIPANWPNRLVRRAVRLRQDHRLPGEWRAAFVVQPMLRPAVAALQ